MIDFVVVSSDLRPYVLDTFGHSVREVFNSHLRKSFSQIPREAGDIESEWTMFSASLLSTRQFEVVDARSLVPVVVAATPEPMVVDTEEVSKGCRQAEEGVLSDHVGLWDSWTQLTGTGRPSKLRSPGTVLEAKTHSGLGGVRVLERRIRPIVDPRIQEEQCGFRPGRGTLDQLYTLHAGCLRVYGSLPTSPTSPHVLCGSGEGIRPCPSWYSVSCILWGVLHEYGVRGPLLKAGCSVSVRPEQELGSHCRQTFSMYVLERFAAECEVAGMRISTSKSEAMVLDRKRVGGVPSPALPAGQRARGSGVRGSRRGAKQGGLLARLKANAGRPPDPVPVPVQCPLPGQQAGPTDRLRLGASREMRNCAVLCHTETWLNDNMPDPAFQIDGRLLFRADRNQQSGKAHAGRRIMRLREKRLVHKLYFGEQPLLRR
ncbi:hypothetical protein L3Q82_017126 [Scortum barcoo]|uniref:Uncharacterized protein n=1 Tax=Scortum barcoo TaxID=214431 RepID=A0ACB8X9H7_9TELE|nr:hypothetical protein L3Q82_017126 [Scortum barcoo]